MDTTDKPKTTRQKLHASILADIGQRTSWENKQVDFYKMRHTGIRRKQKPWNNAADLHFPLIDTNIEKLKPLFFQQVVGMDVVATFVPMLSQLAASTTLAEGWFDYKMREKSNLQSESLAWIDYALMSGRGVMKITWNVRKKQVEFAAIDPIFLIVPAHTKELQDADRIVHVMPMSLEAYKRAGIYDVSKKTLDAISGKEDSDSSSGATASEAATKLREGITHDSKGQHVIVWEVYTMSKDDKWEVRTFSPADPEIDLREPMLLAYDHPHAPFVDFAYEIKDKGWYSPRGIAEILSPFEASLCHTWNQKHDSMQLFNKPVFKSERDMPNTMNMRMGPGSILPNGLTPIAMPQPPMSFDQEMSSTRGIAEQRVSNPDYGMSQVMDGNNRRTATEISAIGAQAQQAGDLRARLFRMALCQAYKMAWALLVQYDKEDLMFRFQDAAIEVDVAALHEKYHIEPKGGVNEVNKVMLLQKAVQRKQLFANSAWINQPELDKSIIELDDPSLIKRLFQDPNEKAQNEQADEGKNIPALMLGVNIPVRKGDNYELRIGVLMQFIQHALQGGMPMPPVAGQAFVARIEGLLQGAATVDNNGAKKLGNDVGKFLQSVGMMPKPQAAGAPVPPPAPQVAPQAPAPLQRPAQPARKSVQFHRDANGKIAGATIQ